MTLDAHRRTGDLFSERPVHQMQQCCLWAHSDHIPSACDLCPTVTTTPRHVQSSNILSEEGVDRRLEWWFLLDSASHCVMVSPVQLSHSVVAGS
eukprot:CAMPEP_0175953524 /NCGR_PEP_ID=MMETSP0108-20121206/31404_1 /TAXON_ID=195067 ORGANISM="Goniomonas pacifica, Strain CCMP1869" /NCGR_SAMPLE_ID=MMETSP0108 /ASSEMBLY_ACC=CAM_ASM_000204 /LENGTH=93 /DNA_ID=CAMNT_0017280105 /DNA_START=315 /DNA_END=597 /DNA_ORIENTATION=-